MKKILFVDNVYPGEYDADSLLTKPLGGTEATVIRIAEGLASTGLFEVAVEQKGRQHATQNKAAYLPYGRCEKADFIICLRDPAETSRLRLRFPASKIYLWSHDLTTQPFVETLDQLYKQSIEAQIFVSQFHRSQHIEIVKPCGFTGQYPLEYIYNPLDESIYSHSKVPMDKNKLVWFSSPHKGLEHAFKYFEALLRFNPNFKLYVSNPGYLKDYIIPGTSIYNNVVFLGALPHPMALEHVKDSLCVFYPNIVFPETFGLVFAEANALGVPVLTHPLGAAREVLDHPAQIVDCRSVKNVVDRVMAWYSGNRPRVMGKTAFKLSNVLKSWINLLRR